MAESQISTKFPADLLAGMLFPAAAGIWLETRQNIDDSTRKNYRDYIKSLSNFFAGLTLAEITREHVRTYQSKRQKGEIPGLPRKAGPSLVNHEINTVQQVMVRAGEWDRIARWYEPLRVPQSRIGRALSDNDEARLLQVASTRKRWFVAYCCALITANTTCGFGEIRHLQLQDVDLDQQVIHIREEGAKTPSRVRSIPLNVDALWAVRQLMERSIKLGAHRGDHYLLPHRAANRAEKADPNRPAGSCRKAWESLRAAAGMPKLRYYDLRHHADTKLLEDPTISEQTAMDIMGHKNSGLLRHYSHIRAKAKRQALDAINTGIKRGAEDPPERSCPTLPAAGFPSLATWSSFTFGGSISSREPTPAKTAKVVRMPFRVESA